MFVNLLRTFFSHNAGLLKKSFIMKKNIGNNDDKIKTMIINNAQLGYSKRPIEPLTPLPRGEISN